MAQAAPVYASGFDATASILVQPANTLTELNVIAWTCNPSAKWVEFFTSRSGLYPIRQPTFRDLMGTLDIEYDFSTPTYSSLGLNLQPGNFITNLQLYINQTSRYSGSGTGQGALNGPYWYINQAAIYDMPQAITVDGKDVTRINWKTGNAQVMFPS